MTNNAKNYNGLGVIWASLFTDVKSFMRVTRDIIATAKVNTAVVCVCV